MIWIIIEQKVDFLDQIVNQAEISTFFNINS